jgi:hypothetical protein
LRRRPVGHEMGAFTPFSARIRIFLMHRNYLPLIALCLGAIGISITIAVYIRKGRIPLRSGKFIERDQDPLGFGCMIVLYLFFLAVVLVAIIGFLASK